MFLHTSDVTSLCWGFFSGGRVLLGIDLHRGSISQAFQKCSLALQLAAAQLPSARASEDHRVDGYGCDYELPSAAKP